MMVYQRPLKDQIFVSPGCNPGVYENPEIVLEGFLQKGAKIMTKPIQN